MKTRQRILIGRPGYGKIVTTARGDNVFNETSIRVQFETLNDEGEKFWATARTFWADEKGLFQDYSQEASEFVEKTHDAVLAEARLVAEALKEVHHSVQIVKNVVRTTEESEVVS